MGPSPQGDISSPSISLFGPPDLSSLALTSRPGCISVPGSKKQQNQISDTRAASGPAALDNDPLPWHRPSSHLMET